MHGLGPVWVATAFTVEDSHLLLFAGLPAHYQTPLRFIRATLRRMGERLRNPSLFSATGTDGLARAHTFLGQHKSTLRALAIRWVSEETGQEFDAPSQMRDAVGVEQEI